MLRLEITPDEQAILVEILEAEVTELRAEIHHTDRLDYKRMLETREQVVKDLLARVRALQSEQQPA